MAAPQIPIPPPAALRELRTGRVKRLGATNIVTGIAKTPREGAVCIGPVGVDGDEQGEKIIHGGPEKAVLHYAADHYETWKRELPERAPYFAPGGFGENLVAYGLDETNMCIGDVVRLGGAVLQVAQPRQPCFKLNHRFHEPSMSRRAQETGRTGWYYRVLQVGDVKAGDLIQVVERPHPDWPVRRVQHYLYAATLDRPALEQLAGMKELAVAARGVFAKRLEASAVESWDDRLIDEENSVQLLRGEARFDVDVTVERVERESDTVKTVVLAAADGKRLPPYSAGAHVELALPGGLSRCYSLCNAPGEPAYRIGVGLDPRSRGGSRYIHDAVRPGDRLRLRAPANNFPLDKEAASHVLIGGGIGITPLLAMAAQLQRQNADFVLHYIVRTLQDAGFARDLAALPRDRVHLHFTRSAAGRPALAPLIGAARPDTAIYCCGPRSLMEAVREVTSGWDPKRIHFEAFNDAFEGTKPFEVTIRSTGQILTVPADKSLLEILRQSGFGLPSSCEAGTCATCQCGYEGGEIEHRDFILSPAERRSLLATCVSRVRSGRVVLKL